MALKVFVVEDSFIVRVRLAAMINEVAGLEVSGEANNAADAIAGICTQRPAAAIVDIKLREGSGLDVVRAVSSAAPGTETIVLTNHASPEFRHRCLTLGAHHFLDKTIELEQVKAVLESIGHRAVLVPEIVEVLGDTLRTIGSGRDETPGTRNVHALAPGFYLALRRAHADGTMHRHDEDVRYYGPHRSYTVAEKLKRSALYLETLARTGAWAAEHRIPIVELQLAQSASTIDARRTRVVQ